MGLPRLMLHKDEVEALFEPRERQLPLPSSFAAISQKIVLVKEQNLEAQEVPPDDSVAPEKQRLFLTYDAIRTIERIANDFAKLPHAADHSYASLAFIFGAILFGSAFLNMWIFALPYTSGKEGLDANISFLHGILSYNEFIALIPWVETINFILPGNMIPARSRIVAVMVGISSQKLLDSFIAQGWWSREHETFFPIPFSIIVTEFVAVPIALLTLYVLNRDTLSRVYAKLCWVLFTYLLALFMASIWADCFNRLSGDHWQKVWALTFGLLRFFVKILCLARTAIEINNKRWVILTLIVDLIFARIQVGILPFIQDWLTLLSLLAGSFGTLIWRYYSGSDRLQLLFRPLWRWIKGDSREIASLQESYGNSAMKIIVGVSMASLKVVHDTSARSIVLYSLSRSSTTKSDTEVATRIPEKCDGSLVSNTSRPSSPKEKRQAAPISVDHSSCALSSQGNQALVQVLNESVVKSAEMLVHVDRIADVVPCNALDNRLPEKLLGVADAYSDFVDVPLDFDEPECHQHLSMDLGLGLVTNPAKKQTSLCSSLKTSLSRFTVSQPDRPFTVTERVMAAEEEEIWFQRQLYHIVDSVASQILSLFVLIQHLAALWLGRNLAVRNHLNSAFEISAIKWTQARIFGLACVLGDVFVIASLTILFRRVKERELTMSRVLSYIFRNNFWFFFLWVTATGAYSSATMINHFGADFTLV